MLIINYLRFEVVLGLLWVPNEFLCPGLKLQFVRLTMITSSERNHYQWLQVLWLYSCCINSINSTPTPPTPLCLSSQCLCDGDQLINSGGSPSYGKVNSCVDHQLFGPLGKVSLSISLFTPHLEVTDVHSPDTVLVSVMCWWVSVGVCHLNILVCTVRNYSNYEQSIL